MKRFALILLAGVALTGCDQIRHKIGEEVRQVEIGDSIVSDGFNSVYYHTPSDTNSLDLENNDAELYVVLTDVSSGATFKMSLGSECGTFPAPKGQRFLVKFDKSASKAKPNDVYMVPQSDQVYHYLCG